MRKKRFASLNILLAAAGAAILFFFLTPRHVPATRGTAQLQTVEQERMAAVYFRVLSFLSSVMPESHAVSSDPAPSKPNCVSAPARVELCNSWTGHDKPAENCRRNTLSNTFRRPS